MIPNARQQEIITLAHERGFVAVEELAAHFDVTPQTIRRDINTLCDHSYLRRFHGGAGAPTTAENLPYDRRVLMAQDEKRDIARLLAAHIPNRASLFIDVGTTCEEAAKALMNHQGLRIITNNLNIAQRMAQKSDFEVTITGGLVRTRDRAVVGEAAVDFINQFNVDFGLLGTSGIGADGTLRDFDYRKVKVSQAIIANSKQCFLAADPSKFGREAMVKSGQLQDLAALFVSGGIPETHRAAVAQANIDVFDAQEG